MVHRYKQFYNAINLTLDYLLLNVSLIAVYNFLDNSLIPWMNNAISDDDRKVYNTALKTYLLYLSLICVIILLVIGTKSYFITKEYLFYSMSLFGILLGAWKIVFFAIRKSDRVLFSNSRKAIIV